MTSPYIDSLLDGVVFDDALHEIAEHAARAVVGVDSAAAVVHRGSEVVRASSDPLASTVDAVQYQIWQGPCLHAFHTGRVVLLDLGTDDARWPDFQAAAVGAGARTVLSLPLRLAEEPIGSLNLYSRTAGAFSPKVVRQVELFARPAALRLSRLGVAVHAADAAEVVGLELQDRARIERAVGVLMWRFRDASSQRALGRLEQTATDLGIDIVEAADHVLDSARGSGA